MEYPHHLLGDYESAAGINAWSIYRVNDSLVCFKRRWQERVGPGAIRARQSAL
jgi:hypothetical protein